jgi:hypothetical protein
MSIFNAPSSLMVDACLESHSEPSCQSSLDLAIYALGDFVYARSSDRIGDEWGVLVEFC